MLTAAIIFISGLIGLGFGQTAKINVSFPPPVALNKAVAAPAPAQPLTCSIEVDFYNASNKLVKTQKFSMTPGQAQQASLSRGELGSPLASHPLFWAQVEATACSGVADCTVDDCRVVATGQEADALGNTNLVFNGNRIRFAPF